MNILNDFAIAIAQPKRYHELLPNKPGRVALYVIIAVLVSSFGIILSCIQLNSTFGVYFENNVPDFRFEDRQLSAEKSFNLTLGGTRIMIDTSRNLTEDDFDGATEGLLIDSDSIIVHVGSRTLDIKYYDIPETEGLSLTKESLYSYAWIARLVLLFTALLSLIFYAMGFMFRALIAALLASLLSSLMPSTRQRLWFGSVYKLALYSLALPTILSLLLPNIFGGILGLAISVFMLNLAIVNSTSNSPEI